MNQIAARIIIPADINFSDLCMSRDPRTGDLEFSWTPIERICSASGIDVRLFRGQPEDNLGGLLAHWYAQHRAAGGLPDLIMDDLIGESEIEDTHGHGFSHKPGQA